MGLTPAGPAALFRIVPDDSVDHSATAPASPKSAYCWCSTSCIHAVVSQLSVILPCPDSSSSGYWNNTTIIRG